jgi:hypothetical protein
MELLNKIQKELKAPKSQLNKFGNYKYRNCEDILEAVKPLLGEGTLVLSDEVVQLGERFYVKATATLCNGDTNPAKRENVSVTAYAREAFDKKGMDDAQITGAASSYARKYALNGLFCIDDTKDADTQDNTAPAPTAKDLKLHTGSVAAAPKQAKVAAPAIVKSVEELQKATIRDLCDNKALAPLLSKGDYHRYIKENTGLEMVAENYKTIIERLTALR